MKYTTRAISVMVTPEGKDLFCAESIEVRIADSSGVVSVSQCAGTCTIEIGGDEWPALREAIDLAFVSIKNNQEQKVQK
jgi:hypothetical protein